MSENLLVEEGHNSNNDVPTISSGILHQDFFELDYESPQEEFFDVNEFQENEFQKNEFQENEFQKKEVQQNQIEKNKIQGNEITPLVPQKRQGDGRPDKYYNRVVDSAGASSVCKESNLPIGTTMRGRVVKYIESRGFGFIEIFDTDKTRVFVGDSEITGECLNAAWKSLGEGEIVEFELFRKYSRKHGKTLQAGNVRGINWRRLRGSPYVMRVKGGTDQRQGPISTDSRPFGWYYNNQPHDSASSNCTVLHQTAPCKSNGHNPRAAFTPHNARGFDDRNLKAKTNDYSLMPRAQKEFKASNVSKDKKEGSTSGTETVSHLNAAEPKKNKPKKKKKKGIQAPPQPISVKLAENDNKSKGMKSSNTDEREPSSSVKPKPIHPNRNANWKNKVKQAPQPLPQPPQPPQRQEHVIVQQEKKEPLHIFTSDLGGKTFHSICQLRPIEDLYRESSKAKEDKDRLEIEAGKAAAESLDQIANVVEVLQVSDKDKAESRLEAIASTESPVEEVRSIEKTVAEVKTAVSEVESIETAAVQEVQPTEKVLEEIKVIETAAVQEVQPTEEIVQEVKVIDTVAAQELQPTEKVSVEIKVIETAAVQEVQPTEKIVQEVKVIDTAAAQELQPTEKVSEEIKVIETAAVQEVQPTEKIAEEVKSTEAVVECLMNTQKDQIEKVISDLNHESREDGGM